MPCPRICLHGSRLPRDGEGSDSMAEGRAGMGYVIGPTHGERRGSPRRRQTLAHVHSPRGATGRLASASVMIPSRADRVLTGPLCRIPAPGRQVQRTRIASELARSSAGKPAMSEPGTRKTSLTMSTEVAEPVERGKVGASGVEYGSHGRVLDVRLVGLDGGAPGAELLRLSSGVLELGAGVGIDELAGLDSLEAVMLQEPRVRCFQQRPGNSAGPEIDVSSAFGADRVLDRHIRDLHPAAGREHAEELGEDGVLVRDQVDHAVRDDDIEALVRETAIVPPRSRRIRHSRRPSRPRRFGPWPASPVSCRFRSLGPARRPSARRRASPYRPPSRDRAPARPLRADRAATDWQRLRTTRRLPPARWRARPDSRDLPPTGVRSGR